MSNKPTHTAYSYMKIKIRENQGTFCGEYTVVQISLSVITWNSDLAMIWWLVIDRKYWGEVPVWWFGQHPLGLSDKNLETKAAYLECWKKHSRVRLLLTQSKGYICLSYLKHNTGDYNESTDIVPFPERSRKMCRWGVK